MCLILIRNLPVNMGMEGMDMVVTDTEDTGMTGIGTPPGMKRSRMKMNKVQLEWEADEKLRTVTERRMKKMRTAAERGMKND